MSGGKAAVIDNDLLKLFFWGTAIANVADNAASSPLTNLYLALHTADPTTAGDQTSHEAAYGSYARQAIPRSSLGFAISGNVVTLAANQLFPTATGGTVETEQYFSVGSAISGTGKIFYRGPLAAPIVVSATATPMMTTATTITEN